MTEPLDRSLNSAAIPPLAGARGLRWLAAVPLAVFVVAAGFAAVGGPQGPAEAAVALLPRWVWSGGWAALYLLAAAGWGRAWTVVVRPSAEAAMLRVGLGLGTLLAVSHGLGVMGLMGGGEARWVALLTLVVPALVELVFWGKAIRSGGGRALLTTETAIAAVPFVAGGLVLAMACNPPGWLWASEFGGYDALSYHLALPQEWLVAGRLAPSSANVYSFLPSYFEAAFMHLGAAGGSPEVGLAGERWLTATDGRGLIACQLLHGGSMLLAVWMIGCVARAVMPEGVPERRAAIVVALVRALLLVTPWSIVVGSLAYNEWPMIALGAAGLWAAMDGRLTVGKRAVLVAVLVGSACGVKPTAMLFFGPGALVLGLVGMQPRKWVVFGVVGALVGLVVLAPWMIRNFVAAGNVVFPFAPGVFGYGHWTLEQHERFAAAHEFSGSVVERLKLLVWPDATDPAGARHRGMLHPQYGCLMVLMVVAALMAGVHRVRWLVVWIAVFGLMMLAWMFTTHLQSRFLMPLMVPGAVMLAGVMVMMRGKVGAVVWGVATAVQIGFVVMLVMREHGGQPNRLLLAGPGLFSGEVFAAEVGAMAAAERAEWFASAPPEVRLNLDPALRVEGVRERVLLIGDATSLYFANGVASTVWDRSPLADAMAEAPENPAEWTTGLARGGFGLALVNLSELQRFERSGYGDPKLNARAVAAWVEGYTTPIETWPARGRVLVRLRVPASLPQGTPAAGGERAP